jgi:hypothetical protein
MQFWGQAEVSIIPFLFFFLLQKISLPFSALQQAQAAPNQRVLRPGVNPTIEYLCTSMLPKKCVV